MSYMGVGVGGGANDLRAAEGGGIFFSLHP